MPVRPHEVSVRKVRLSAPITPMFGAVVCAACLESFPARPVRLQRAQTGPVANPAILIVGQPKADSSKELTMTIAFDRFRRPDPPDQAPETTRKPVPFLARLSGRDPDILAVAPDDVVSESAGLGLALIVAALLHWVGFVAAFIVFNVPPILAVAIASVSAAGLFAMDRGAAHSTDLDRAETAVHKANASDFPRLSSALRGWFVTPLRVLFSVLTAFFAGSAIVLHFFAADLVDQIEREQIERDRPVILQARAALDGERDGLERALDEGAANLEAFDASAMRWQEQHADRIAPLAAEVERLHDEVSILRETETESRADAEAQRDIMRCELVTRNDFCPDASGMPGKGERYYLAEGRANAADVTATDARTRLNAAESALRAAIQLLDEVRGAAPSNDPDVRETYADKVTAAAEALGTFDSGRDARADQMMRHNPMRDVIDQHSLAARLLAAKRLAAENQAFFYMSCVVAGVAFAFELLAQIKLATMRLSEYHLIRGEQLTQTMRAMRDRHQQGWLDNATLRAAVRKQARAEANENLAAEVFARATGTGRPAGQMPN